MASERELLAARIICRAVFPVVKVLLEDDPGMKRRFENVSAVVQFRARDASGDVGGHWRFENGKVETSPELAEKADVTFTFGSVAKMNAFFAGKLALPWISGLRNFGLLVNVFRILLALKILMPNAKPKTPEQARLKVKMTLYMVSTGLSQLNKAGDPDMQKWTSRQPERIYQWSCEPEGIAVFLRIKAGKSKSGRGVYTRRKPFVHMKFNGVDGALPVLAQEVDTVQAIAKGLVTLEGSPEYGAALGDFMVRVGKLVTG